MTNNIVIRDFVIDDLEQVQGLHEKMGIDYKFPDVGSPLFIVKKVAEKDGKIIAASTLRVEAETYLWLDKSENPVELFEVEVALQKAVFDEAFWEKGINNVVAWIPRHVEDKFAKRLKKLGWSRDREGWISYSCPTGDTGCV